MLTQQKVFCQTNSTTTNKIIGNNNNYTNSSDVTTIVSLISTGRSTTTSDSNSNNSSDDRLIRPKLLIDEDIDDYGSSIDGVNTNNLNNYTNSANNADKLISFVNYDTDDTDDSTGSLQASNSTSNNTSANTTSTSSTDTTDTTTNNTFVGDDEDLGYDDEEIDGSGSGGGQGCDSGNNNEGVLSKMIAIHELNKNLTFSKRVPHINDTFARIRHVRQLYRDYFAPKKGFDTELLAFVSSIDIVLSPECFASFFSLISGLRNNKLWANKFMDTMGRIMETGTADGKHSSFGEYDECLAIESPEDRGLVVKGQYCLVKVVLPYPEVGSYTPGDGYDPLFDDQGIAPFKYFNGANSTTIVKMIENLNLYRGSTYRLGLCTPHYCKRNEIEEFINKVMYPITRLPLELGRHCIRNDKQEDYTLMQLLSIMTLVVLTILTITSTGIEIYNIVYERSLSDDSQTLGSDTKFVEEDPLVISPYYYTFSLVTNTRELLAYPSSSSSSYSSSSGNGSHRNKTINTPNNNRFVSLDTIRLFVIMHIYVFHLYNTMATIGIVTLKRAYATYPYRVLELDRYTTLRNTLFFDILFIMSGFMLSNSLLSKLERNGGNTRVFNYFKYILTRYLRFAVPLLGSIIFLFVLPLMGSGPIWDEGVQWVTRGCENWQVVLFGFLFIGNYNDQLGIMDRQQAVPYCNPSTWFVSALFQLHILVPMIVIVYHRNSRRGLYLACGVLAVGMVVSVLPALVYNILPQMQYIQMDSTEQIYRSFSWYHLSTTQYLVGFVTGVTGGYLIRRDWSGLRIEYEVVGWLSSLSAICIVYMWSNTFWKVQRSAPLYSVLLWFTVGKFSFALAVTWILFCLCTGRAKTLDYLLSWPNFQPLSRLTFSFFMIHFMIIIRRVFTVKETITMTDGLMMEYSIIDIIYTFILSFIFYSLIEAPFTNLMAIWLKKTTNDNNNSDEDLVISADNGWVAASYGG
ncbi:nose resistant to fluoxetine protein 6-like [Oppia nitens]|uniref:nose resistant to fluoxetine protein 6-like n=1 Tax=Oppia nitens TaxID=1686743 RepID=UPI0023DA07CC|nr:nose resistant to fluoxetine protein 6-like [Oppia nitens]